MGQRATVKQIQALDRIAINQWGVPSLALMENAGRCVADEVRRLLHAKKNPRVCVVCGVGNNAGDGFVAARHLGNAGIKTTVFLIGPGSRLKQDAAVNYKILKRSKYPIYGLRDHYSFFCREVARADVVVDAIFGVGLSRAISDPFKSVIECLNVRARRVVAVDVPSGLDATTGKVYGVCVRADRTVTFSCAKQGFFKHEGPRHTGKVAVVDIGIPVQLTNKIKRSR